MVRWRWIKLPVPGRPTNSNSRAWAYCACCGKDGCSSDIFSLVYHFSLLRLFLSLSLSLSLGDGPI